MTSTGTLCVAGRPLAGLGDAPRPPPRPAADGPHPPRARLEALGRLADADASLEQRYGSCAP